MLGNLAEQPKDKILETMQLFRVDERPNKVDLGVGVYRDASGNTPIMRSIKKAEQQLWEAETTKAYTGLAGDPAFSNAMCNLILGDTIPADRIAAAATPGGTGAIRQAFELVAAENRDATVWMSDPTWPNHPAIIKQLGLNIQTYRYFDDETRAVDFDGMMADLAGVKSGDVVLLHGCCHNPTGANLNLTE